MSQQLLASSVQGQQQQQPDENASQRLQLFNNGSQQLDVANRNQLPVSDENGCMPTVQHNSSAEGLQQRSIDNTSPHFNVINKEDQQQPLSDANDCIAAAQFNSSFEASAYCEQSSTNEKPNDELSDSLKLLSELYNVKFLNNRLVDTTTEKPFEFHVSTSHKENQSRYNEIGEIIAHHIYELIERQGLLRIQILGGSPKPPKSFFFMSNSKKSKTNKLLVLIHGSGAVRAGQWSRKIILNNEDGLIKGTQLPFIQKAQELNYDIVVMNTNENYANNDHRSPLKNSGSPEEHAFYIWKNHILPSSYEKIAIVAHSYGGVVTAHLLTKFEQDFQKRVRAIALSDSVHWGFVHFAAGKFFSQRARNWVVSHEELDKVIKESKQDATRVSAGHIAHEWTPWSSFKSIFTFIEEKLSLPNDEIHSTETQKTKQTNKSKTFKQTFVNFFTKKK